MGPLTDDVDLAAEHFHGMRRARRGHRGQQLPLALGHREIETFN